MRIGHDGPYLKTATVSADRTTRGELSSRFESELNHILINERQPDDGVSGHMKAPDDWEPYRVTDPSSLAKINIFDKAIADQVFGDFLKLREDARSSFKAGLQVFIDKYEAIIKANPSARNELQPLIDNHRKNIDEAEEYWNGEIEKLKADWAQFKDLK